MSRETHVVGFQVGRETYGVPITSLHEIVRVPEITAVPDAPAYMEGVINLRGKIVSVRRLAQAIWKKRAAAFHRRSRILVVEHRRTTGGHDRRRSVGGAEDSRQRDRTRTRDDAGRRTGLRDRSRQSIKGRLIILLDVGKVLDSGRTSQFRKQPSEPAVTTTGKGGGAERSAGKK